MSSGQGRAIMVQGTASSAGKSFLVAGLCRLLANEGLSVAPFKAQNMSNNAFVTAEGLEIGRAQAVQAFAARIRPHVDMNPVLLKPEADHRSQVVVMGKPVATLAAAAYQELKEQIWGDVTAAVGRLREGHDVVVIEGAGSPAEINLKARDISNMRVALHARSPVLLVGDIDRGGVFAHLYGTYWLLDPPERALVKGFVINKFRGDPSLLEPGLTDIARLTDGVPVAGVIPWVHDLRLPEEDSVAIDRRKDAGGPFDGLDVAVLRFPRIANFDDFDPLEAEADVRVRYVEGPSDLREPDLIILPGTKATVADLDWLRSRGLEEELRRSATMGVPVIGICGGFQMLGRSIDDPDGVESTVRSIEGLGLIDAQTRFSPAKRTRQSTAVIVTGEGMLRGLKGVAVDGYEIHAGRTTIDGPVAVRTVGGDPLGALDDGGWVFGCYLHGLFRADLLRQRLLENVARLRGKHYRPSRIESDDAAFDRLAHLLRSSLDLDLVHRLLEQV
jgi:adenosylcobyric acid synthase